MPQGWRGRGAGNGAEGARPPATPALPRGDGANSPPERATRSPPAVTIVAAWINADTGVGPCIASGSHVNRGICADLPVQPRNRNSVTAVTVAPAGVDTAPARADTGPKTRQPGAPRISNLADREPTS